MMPVPKKTLSSFCPSKREMAVRISMHVLKKRGDENAFCDLTAPQYVILPLNT